MVEVMFDVNTRQHTTRSIMHGHVFQLLLEYSIHLYVMDQEDQTFGITRQELLVMMVLVMILFKAYRVLLSPELHSFYNANGFTGKADAGHD